MAPAAILFLLLLCVAAHQQHQVVAQQQPSISSGLQALAQQQQQTQQPITKEEEEQAQKSRRSAARRSHIRGDQVRFSAAAVEGCSAEDLARELGSLGGEDIAFVGRVVSGWLPMSKISQLESCKCLHLIRESLHTAKQQSRQGSRAMSVSLKLQGSWRRPVKVGVLSDSFNSLGGYAADVVANALPKGVQVLADSVPASDEGRAMLQVVHAVAPDADLAFHTAVAGDADFANGIRELADAGCRVIVDDIVFFNEPMFQNGIIAQAVNEVRARGVAYFSAAGNDAFGSYRADFVDGGVAGVLPGSKRHSFGVVRCNSTTTAQQQVTSQRITFCPGYTYIVLNWDQPSFSVSGGAGCRTDVNMYVHLPTGNNETTLVIIASADTRNIGGDAFDLLAVYNPEDYHQVAPITIEWVSGVKPGVLKYIILSDDHTTLPIEFATRSATSFGHPAAMGCVAVGAGDYRDARAYTGTTSVRESFSSAVGTPLLFTDDGTRLPQQQLVKNLIMAPDGVDTTFFPPVDLGGLDLNGDLQPEFHGTSAAAPHAAAVAALLMGTAKRGLTVEDVVDVMYRTAEDMDDPRTSHFDRGWDYATGYGMINATRAAKRFNVFACA